MPTPSAARTARGHSVGFNLAAISALVALVAIALAYGIDAAGRTAGVSPHRGEGEVTLTRTIGGKDLEIPLSWFRYAEQRVEGFAKQIDLQLLLPLGKGAAPATIEVTLMPRSRVRPSAGLLDGVYLHQFQPVEISEGPVGLIGKPLENREGFKGETVWYDPLSADPFVAKCVAPVAEGTAARCLRAVYLGPGLAAVYAFGADVLENWRKFDPEIRAALAKIGV
ncbi:MAG: hypothetical protein EOP19_28815 [Hyphomicrobiales bacterium]|nr:MAG: hypothetical protein EOP19_28815 [Hyphomicrobiales bacterium]